MLWESNQRILVPEAEVPLTPLRRGRKVWMPRVQGPREAMQEKGQALSEVRVLGEQPGHCRPSLRIFIIS